jgi:hypothetical protein
MKRTGCMPLLLLLVCLGCGGNERYLPKPRPADPDDEPEPTANAAPLVPTETAVGASNLESSAASPAAPVRTSNASSPEPVGAPTSTNGLADANSRQQVIEQLTQIADSFAEYHRQSPGYPGPSMWSGGMSWRVVTLFRYSSKIRPPKLNLDLEEPWTHPTNQAVLRRIPDRYRSDTLDEGHTNLVLLTGPDTAYPRGASVRECPDGWENTILVVAVDDAYAVPWLAPQDYEFSPTTVHDALFGKFQDCCYALFGGDTGVRRIPATISDEHLMALITPDGGERVSALEVTLPPTPEPDEALIRRLEQHPIVRFAARATGASAASKPDAKQATEAAAQQPADSPSAAVVRASAVPSGLDEGNLAPDSARLAPRMPVPDPVVLLFAQRVLREVHEDEYRQAASTEARRKVAERLFATAQSLEDDPAGRYVALQACRKIAIEAGSFKLALSAADALVLAFEVDEVLEKSEVFAGTVRLSLPDADSEDLLKAAGPLFKTAMQHDQYEAADQILAAALAAARRLKNTRLIGELANVRKDMLAARKAWSDIEHDVEILLADPSHALANQKVGSYYCFIKQRWEDGLPLLARTDNARLADVAMRELHRPQSSDEELALADAWWQLAETENAYRTAMRTRAAYWYQRVLPGLPAGIERIKAETRLARVEGGN